MPKKSSDSTPPPSSPPPRRAASPSVRDGGSPGKPGSAPKPPGPQLVLGYRVLKLVAFVVGFPTALLGVMALVGGVTENGYARVLGALLVVLATPLFLADRLLPDHDPTRARGLVTDVCTVMWLATGLVIGPALGGVTRPLLTREGDRLIVAGYPDLGKIAYLMGGVSAEIPAAPAPAASGSASATAIATASGSASAEPAASGVADAGGAPDAAAPKAKVDRDKGEKTPAEIFKDFSPSVVTVFVKGKVGEGGGTGFVVDKEGTIATNHHVIDSASAVRIKFQSGAIYENVELLVDEPTADLALVRVDLSAPLDGGARPDLAPLAIGDSDAIVVGERAISIGNPLGLEHTLTDGLVSSRRLYQGKAWIQFSAPISPGNSGGPLFNMKGEVIGVTTATITGGGFGFSVAQNINLAVPVNELKKLLRPSYPGRRKFGDGSAPSHW